MGHSPGVRLTGWNVLPAGYGARFDTAAAPLWLRLLYRTPVVDRFAHPLLVRRGLGLLTPHPHWPEGERGPVSGGWRPDEPAYVDPGSVTELR